MTVNKAVIFDFDGLILDTETAELSIWQDLFLEAGITFDLEAYRDNVGSYAIHPYRPEKILEAIQQNGRTAADIAEEVRNRTIEITSESQPMPGVLSVIQSAKAKGLKLAVGSSSPMNWVKPHLVRLGLWEQFDTVVTNDDVALCKPSPEIFLKVLNRLDVQPYHAIVLEDSANGVLAANRAGIPVVVIPNEITWKQRLDGAAMCLSSLNELNLDLFFTN
jgi:HAD superfamily hydrolase (TIGR01509 family)